MRYQNAAEAALGSGGSPQDRRIEELLLLQRSTQRINSILDLEVLLQEIVVDVRETFGYSRPGVFLRSDDSDDQVLIAGWIGYHQTNSDEAGTSDESMIATRKFRI